MEFATLREIVNKLDGPNALKQDTITFFEELPPTLRSGVVGTTIALMWAGLKIGLVKPATPTTAITKKTDLAVYDTFRLNAMNVAVRSELKLWKSFHAIDAELKDYCNLIATHSSSPGNRSLEDIRRAIYDAFAPMLRNPRTPDFYTLTKELHRNGYAPLLASLQSFLELGMTDGAPNTAAIDIVKRLEALEYRSPHEWIDDTERLSDLIRDASEILTDRIPADTEFGPTLREFIQARYSAGKAALRFSSAVFMAERFLALDAAPDKIDDKAYRYQHDMLRWFANELPDGMPQRVVNLSNNVIFSWIDILGMAKDPRETTT